MPLLAELAQEFWARVWRCKHYHCQQCCWPWGSPDNYQTSLQCYVGRFHHGVFFDPQRKKGIAAHRLAYELAHDGMMILPGRGFVICHRCDYGACNNPAHLCLGAPADNMRDKRGKPLWDNPHKYALLPDGRRIMFVHPWHMYHIQMKYDLEVRRARKRLARLARIAAQQEAAHGSR